MGLLNTLFKSRSEREIKKIMPLVSEIEALEETYRAMSDSELRGKTAEFKARLNNNETLENIMPEAFAAVREAADRVLGLRPFHVQLIGGVILHQGRIAEMKTGEGKTLVATLPSYVNALTGKGVHIITVNDYLAKYQGELMGRIHRFLGLTVGVIVHDMTSEERRAAYNCDITYGTNNEFGFDYLRDNMAIYKEDMVQREHAYAIVDEIDSILIDEARTPLIISGQGEKPTLIYQQVDKFAAGLKCLKVASLDEKEEHDDVEADYIVDEKARSATLTPSGIAKAEAFFQIENLSDPDNAALHHHINQAIRARGIMQRDVDYVVREGQIIIVDEFTGRLMFGRRYSEGLHQAIEAKERVSIQRESKTLATITFQNYFRLYSKLSGMTGTALTEEEEFKHIYNLDVVEIPTNKPMIRTDHPDVVYKTEAGKFRAVVRQIEECQERGQPVLVGTVSIEKSEILSDMLRRRGVKHVVLNAKHHEKEAEIVAQAGKLGAVTIATNMAGRGTDIMLGGNADFMAKSELRRQGMPEDLIIDAGGTSPTDNPEILEARDKYQELYREFRKLTDAESVKVCEAGGLFVIGTERHEARRIDNQLRGRSGRQGDPGESRFYLSLEDDVMRLFGSERIMGMMNALGLDEDTPIEQKVLTNAIESAQKRVESRNFAIRKNVLQFDDVMNKQREIIYGQRKTVLNGEDIENSIKKMIEVTITQAVDFVMGEEQYVQTWHLEQIRSRFAGLFLSKNDLNMDTGELNEKNYDKTDLIGDLTSRAEAVYAKREQEFGDPVMRELERVVLLKTVDEHWMDHIDAMHELRQGIGLRAYGQQDPILEYKREGHEMFEEMINSIRETTVQLVFTARIRGEGAPQRERVAKVTGESAGDETLRKEPVRKDKKPGRNDPCPCGSGKKYKKCCGINE
ncbi:MAG: preprotein translocase subunit SecA [Clostridiales bacterium]|jgi:preprotein translocase subunit SecA|nr:preprotein translocase subunit SecA [Clostridiales bacterium]